MPGLTFPDLHHVRAAEGWLALGALDDAAAELRRLTSAGQGHPEVLELRWNLAIRRGQWEAALDLARLVVLASPERPTGWIHQSYALHELKRTDEAWTLLRPMADRFPTDSTIPYNLACYACQLGDLAGAREWIARAIKLGGKREIKAMALEDVDLVPLRPWLETL